MLSRSACSLPITLYAGSRLIGRDSPRPHMSDEGGGLIGAGGATDVGVTYDEFECGTGRTKRKASSLAADKPLSLLAITVFPSLHGLVGRNSARASPPRNRLRIVVGYSRRWALSPIEASAFLFRMLYLRLRHYNGMRWPGHCAACALPAWSLFLLLFALHIPSNACRAFGLSASPSPRKG